MFSAWFLDFERIPHWVDDSPWVPPPNTFLSHKNSILCRFGVGPSAWFLDFLREFLFVICVETIKPFSPPNLNPLEFPTNKPTYTYTWSPERPHGAHWQTKCDIHVPTSPTISSIILQSLITHWIQTSQHLSLIHIWRCRRRLRCRSRWSPYH